MRPGRGKSRPRSKERPAHARAGSGVVLAVDRGRFTVLLGASDASADSGDSGDSGDPPTERATVLAIKSREVGRKGVVVGDMVAVVGDTSGGQDALARIVRVSPRATVLRRTADDTDPVERVVVANADQLAIVAAIADPEPRTGLIDRCLVAAYDAGLAPLLVLTKPDLADPQTLLQAYAALDVPYAIVPRGAPGADLRARLAGRATVLIGHSGVGKSTVVNALVPGATRSTGRVNTVTGRGRHTSTSAVALPLPGGGWIIDTPGIRSFGLAHVDLARVLAAFPDLAAGTAECPRACGHDEPECGLDEWVATGRAGAAGRTRLDSLRRLLRSRQANDYDAPADT